MSPRGGSIVFTVLILALALAAGCGGSGGAGGPGGANGLGGVSTTGQLTLRVSTGEGPPQVRVEGDTVHLSVSSQSRSLLVQLFRGEQSEPTLSRLFDLGEGSSTAVVDNVPAPANYLVRGELSAADGSPMGQFQTHVEIRPGQVTTALVSLSSPSPSPSFSPSPSPSPSPSASPVPGNQFDISDTVAIFDNAYVDMRDDGGFAAGFASNSGAAKGIYLRTYSGPPAGPTANFAPLRVFNPATGTVSGANVAVDENDHVGLIWRRDTTSQFIESQVALFATGTAITGTETIKTLAPGANADNFSFSMPNVPAKALASWLEAPPPTGPFQIMGSLVEIPTGNPGAPQGLVAANSNFVNPVSDQDATGATVLVFRDNSSNSIKGILFSNDLTTVVNQFTVATGVTPNFNGDLAVAIRDGTIAVTWSQDPQNDGQIETFLVHVVYNPANLATPPSASLPVSVDVDPEASFSTATPDVGVDANGNTVVVWRRFAAYPGLGAADIFGRVFDATGAGGTAFKVSATLDPNLDNNRVPKVAMDGSGRYVVVWMQNLNGTETAVGRGYPALFGLP